MCDDSRKLILWLDGELPADEAAEVGRHLRGCAQCQVELKTYEQLSGALDAYCEATLTAAVPRRPNRRPVMWSAGVAAAVAVVAVLLALPRAHNTQPPAAPPPGAAPAFAALPPAPASVTALKTVHRRPAAAPVRQQEANLPPAQPAIQITIPAEDVFPPGAVPEGVVFVSNVRVSQDGSQQSQFVWP